MATVNVSEDGKQNIFTTAELLYCSSDITAGIHDQFTALAVLNAFLSITTFLGNVLILAALRKESSLHPPSKVLLSNLATTDLCVGLIVEPQAVIFLMSAVNENWEICRYAVVVLFITGITLCSVSLLTLTAISVDRLLALLLGLRYRQVVTLKRAYLIVVTFWAVSTIFSAMQFFNIFIALWCGIILILFCLVTSTFCYTKIFLTLRHNQNQVQEHVHQTNQTNQLNIARYRKAVSTALCLKFTLLACYLPQVILATLLGIHAEPFSSVSLAFGFTTALVFVSSSLNPILYCWKIEEVRQAVKDTIIEVLCC
ncbi:beta-4C adrenergic receptor-like [Orbicella faveolata]|nr:beta-4C adrenergic receptor-like [Orbicella faveolata]